MASACPKFYALDWVRCAVRARARVSLACLHTCTSTLPYPNAPQPILAVALSQTGSNLTLGQAKSQEASLSQTVSMPLVCLSRSLTADELRKAD